MKHWMIIENKREYEEALKRTEHLMEMNPGIRTVAGKELKLLMLLIEKYEDEHYPIGDPDPIEAIKTRMEDLGLDAKHLVRAIGDKGTVSKVLNRRIPLSLKMIRNLSRQLHLPADILIQKARLAVA